MKNFLFLISFLGAAVFGAGSAFAQQAFSCSSAYGGYCQYEGKIQQIYVNDGNQILMYFEDDVDPATISAAGISGVTRFSAGGYLITDNEIYAEYLYSTMVTAQASKRPVKIQFFGTSLGYLKLSKIWLAE